MRIIIKRGSLQTNGRLGDVEVADRGELILSQGH